MGKGKLKKFADLEHYTNVFQYPFGVLCQTPFPLRGQWHAAYFRNDNPIVLELGCGKGEYTVGIARLQPHTNVIGVDIKGARIWTGATQARDEALSNAAFVRTSIELTDNFFAPGEVAEIWLTFSDPQMSSPRKRLTSTTFLERYRRFLVDGGIIHLKTDSNFLFTYTRLLAERNRLPVDFITEDLYASAPHDPILSIRTYYETQWLDRGFSIKYIRFHLPHGIPLVEPDVEIPVDDYRSFRRDKRSGRTTAV